MSWSRREFLASLSGGLAASGGACAASRASGRAGHAPGVAALEERLGWRAGDKTGTSGNGACNDVAIVWPDGRAPLLIAAYTDGLRGPDAARAGALAEIARMAVAGLP